MNNLFFKSPETYKKLIQSLDFILDEQRHQRGDLATIKRQLHTLVSSDTLAGQAADYFRQKKLDEDFIEQEAETVPEEWLLSQESDKRLESTQESKDDIVIWILQTNSFESLFLRVIELEHLNSKDT